MPVQFQFGGFDPKGFHFGGFQRDGENSGADYVQQPQKERQKNMISDQR